MFNMRGSRNAVFNTKNETGGFGVYILRPTFTQRPCPECVGKGFTYSRQICDDGRFRTVMGPCDPCRGKGFFLEMV